jgi:flagellar protein FliS
MFGSPHSGATAYAKVGVETGVVAASPHSLITMLFDGALAAIASAHQNMLAERIEDKGLAVSKAITIINDGLRASLDKKAGGQIAQSLDSLYEYMSNRLFIANLQNRPEILDEVASLLKDLKSAWDAIGTPAASAAATPPPKMPVYDPLAPRISNLVKA